MAAQITGGYVLQPNKRICRSPRGFASFFGLLLACSQGLTLLQSDCHLAYDGAFSRPVPPGRVRQTLLRTLDIRIDHEHCEELQAQMEEIQKKLEAARKQEVSSAIAPNPCPDDRPMA